MKIQLPNSIFGKNTGEAFKRVLEREVSAVPLQTTAIPTNIQNIEDCWRVEGVNYNGKVYVVDLAKSLLDNGNAKTQAQWAEYSVLAKQNGSFYTGDMPLYHAVFTSLFKQKDNSRSKKEIEEARAFIQKQMKEKYPMTLTRIAYQPTGKDKIIHNFGTNDRYDLEGDIVGKDREIESGDRKTLNALLGVEDIDEIKSVYNWINQTPAWIWRVNSKPKKVDECVAGFGAYSDWAYLYCNRYADGSDSSLGVRVAQKI